MSETPCLLCGKVAEIVCQQHPGYRDGMHFDIGHCSHCKTAFALPMAVDDSIYELIYSNISAVPGYCRYEQHMLAVAESKDPMAYLTQAEESYWAISKALGQRSPADAAGTSILEIGSGLGYLTHALRTLGYAATGIDLSENAVKVASRRFGPWYRHCYLSDLIDERKQYDYVILSQVVEHVPQIATLLAEAGNALSSNGKIIFTTPNRSLFGDDVVWETELPPVHLWWFSEASVKWLAQSLGFDVEFVDFSQFHRDHARFMPRAAPNVPTRAPILKANGGVHQAPPVAGMKSVAVKALNSLGLEPAVRKLLGRNDSIQGARGNDICAVFSKGRSGAV